MQGRAHRLTRSTGEIAYLRRMSRLDFSFEQPENKTGLSTYMA